MTERGRPEHLVALIDQLQQEANLVSMHRAQFYAMSPEELVEHLAGLSDLRVLAYVLLCQAEELNRLMRRGLTQHSVYVAEKIRQDLAPITDGARLPDIDSAHPELQPLTRHIRELSRFSQTPLVHH